MEEVDGWLHCMYPTCNLGQGPLQLWGNHTCKSRGGPGKNINFNFNFFNKNKRKTNGRLLNN